MKKIMFSDKFGLTKAVLSGRKTQTRRICPDGTPLGNWTETVKKSRYQVGEVVAVAQSYQDIDLHTLIKACIDKGMSKEGFADMMTNSRGSANKMFVRSELMPHQIRITDVRVERLQDISDEDCIAEGVELNPCQYEYDGLKLYFVRNLGHWRMFGCDNFKTPREAYAALIDRISGKETFERNPYVFVYEFELIK